MTTSLKTKQKFELRAPVTPYVCSTPIDFAEERLWLADHVFPKLEEVCCARGTYFSPVDVRWSAEDSLTGEGYLLPTLLDLITQSAPYFLCLLGECYGWYKAGLTATDFTEDSANNLTRVNDWLWQNLNMASHCGYQWVTQDEHPSCSITELEIIAGTLRGNSDQCTFYFRQAGHLDFKLQDVSVQEAKEMRARFLPESTHAELKIHSLKQTIIKRGLPVRYFNTLPQLAEIVMEDWLIILDTVCPPFLDNGQFLDTADYHYWVAQEALLAQLRSNFVQSPMMDVLKETLKQFALAVVDEKAYEKQQLENSSRQNSVPSSVTHSILLLSGDPGVGKSMLLAKWLQDFMEKNPGIYLMYHFIGSSPGDNDIAAFMRRCIRDLRRHFLMTEVTSAMEQEVDSWWSSEDLDTPTEFFLLCQAFAAALTLGPCLLVLDGVNHLSATSGLSQREVKEFGWLPAPLPQHCHIIMSTSRSDLSYLLLCRRSDVRVVPLPGLRKKNKYLRKHYMKTTLKPHVVPYVENDWKYMMDMRLMKLPLGVRVLASRMNDVNVYCNLEEFVDMHYTIALHSLWTSCLQQWVISYSWECEEDSSVKSQQDDSFDYSGWVSDALCLLCVSRGGLRQSEVLNLLWRLGYTGTIQVTLLHWLRFRLCLGSLLWESSDGRMRFCHQHLQDFTQYILLRMVSASSADAAAATSQPLHQSRKRKMHAKLASFFASQPLSWRQALELPWHLLMAGKFNKLLHYLTQSQVIHLFLARQSSYPDGHHDLRLYWSVLEKRGHNVQSYCLHMLRNVGLYSIPCTDQLEVLASSCEGDQEMSKSYIYVPLTSSDLKKQLLLDEPLWSDDWQKHQLADGRQKHQLADCRQKHQLADCRQKHQLADGWQKHQLADSWQKHQLADGVEAVAELTWAVGRFLQELQQVQVAFTVFSCLLTFLQHRSPLHLPTQLLLAQLLERLATMSCASGDHDSALVFYKQALNILYDLNLEAHNIYDVRQIDTFKGTLLDHLAYLQLQAGDMLKAQELLQEAMENVSHLAGNHILRAAFLYHLGLLRGEQGKWKHSEQSLRQCLALRQQWHGQQHPEVATVLLALARVLRSVCHNGRIEKRQEMLSLYRQALDISERCLGKSHMQVAILLTELGELMAEEEEDRHGHYEAHRLLQRSLDIRVLATEGDDVTARTIKACIRRLHLMTQLGRAEILPKAPVQQQQLKKLKAATGFQKSSGVGTDRATELRQAKTLLHLTPGSPTSVQATLISPAFSCVGKGSRVNSIMTSALDSRPDSVQQGVRKGVRQAWKEDGADKYMMMPAASGATELQQEEAQSSTGRKLDKDIPQSPAQIRPHSSPYNHFQPLTSKSPTKPRPRSAVTSSAYSNLHSSHDNRCQIPGAYDLQKSSLSGPHSNISSLQHPPSCPRDNVHPQPHHSCAFYHVPGRYPTLPAGYAPKRCQKTERARALEFVVSTKRKQTDQPPTWFRPASATNNLTRCPTGLNYHHVNAVIAQMGVNRPDSFGGALLASARAPSPPETTQSPSTDHTITTSIKFKETVPV